MKKKNWFGDTEAYLIFDYTVINQTKIFTVWTLVLVKDCFKCDSYNDKNCMLVSLYL